MTIVMNFSNGSIKQVIWSDELVILPGFESRFIPPSCGAMNVLATFNSNTLYFKCSESDLGNYIYSDFFGEIALMHNYNPHAVAVGNDDSNLLN